MDVGSRLFVFLLMLIYTIVSYRVFRGKVVTSAERY
jgi:cytochrome bd-type quinol oxidase subunit 2